MEIFLAIIIAGIIIAWFIQSLSEQEKAESDIREISQTEKGNLRPVGLPPELELNADEEPQYQKKRYFFTYQERMFFEILQKAVGEHFQIFAQTRIGDVIFVANEPTDKKIYNNHLWCRHLDFLLCDHKKKRPLLAIELDDSSHKNYFRKENDEFKNKGCENAGLPLLRFKVSQSYSEQEILEAIQREIEIPVVFGKENSPTPR